MKTTIYILLIAIALTAGLLIGNTYSKKTVTKTVTKTVKSPPKLVYVKEQIPDDNTEKKLEQCRKGFHDAILKINDIQDKTGLDKPLDKKDPVFDTDNLITDYSVCW